MAWRRREHFAKRLQSLAEHDAQSHDNDAGFGSLHGPAPASKDGEACKGRKRQQLVKREPEAEVCVVSRPPEVPIEVDRQTDPKRCKPKNR